MIEVDSLEPFAATLAIDKGFLNESAQVEAKALISDIADEIPSYRWSYLPERLVRNLTLASFELSALSQTDLAAMSLLAPSARKVAQTWEALAKTREGTSANTALLNAAIAYELAGYQANAACLSRLLTRERRDTPREALISLAATFLQRRLLDLSRRTQQLPTEPPEPEESSDSVIELMSLAMTAKGLHAVCESLLSGRDGAADRGASALHKAEGLWSSLGLAQEANTVSGLLSILPVATSRSVWTVLRPSMPGSGRWERYLKLLSRGVGPDPIRARSVSELWPSQIAALQGGLLESDSNKVFRMPTSAGKTRIAEMAIVHTLIGNPGSKCIYIAPFRALATELEEAFFEVVSDLGYRVSTVLGSYETYGFEQSLLREADLLVTTPEKIDLVLRAQPDFLDNVRLLVLDEAQIVDDQRRGPKFELLVTRLRRRIPSLRILLISAVIPQETLEDFAMWFDASPETDTLSHGWRPSVQRVARFVWSGRSGVIRYAETTENQVLSEFVPGVIRSRQFEFINAQTGRRNRRWFPDPTSKAQTAAELAFKLADLGPVLVFCSQTNHVKAVATALSRRLELARLAEEPLPHSFSPREGTISFQLAREWIGDSLTTDLISAGIGVHYGLLPEAVRKGVETDFRRGLLRVLVATNTLAQGVNLPVKTVVVHSCRRYAEESMERISARDYWNIAGRAGRAGHETEGLVLHVVASATDEADFRYYLRRKEDVEPVESSLYRHLYDLVQERMTVEEFSAAMDPEILALLVEEGVGGLPQEPLSHSLEGTYAEVRASRHKTDFGEMVDAFSGVAAVVSAGVPDPADRALYSATGLPSPSCSILRSHIEANAAALSGLLVSAEAGDVDALIEAIVPTCLELPEMQPSGGFAGNNLDLLSMWIRGTSVPSLLEEFGPLCESPEALGKFIEDLFGYRLPWGISAFLRIAQSAIPGGVAAVSEYAAHLPPLVKFGVPDPLACWAMASGVPLRSAAIAMAATYRSEEPNPVHADFMRWLGRLGPEDLHHDYGITGPILERLARALQTAGMNPLLLGFTSIDEFLPREIEVRGIAYEDRWVPASAVQPGSGLGVERDYDSMLDRNAILVKHGGLSIGYVPRQVAQVIAPEIDCGLRVSLVASSVKPGPVPRVLAVLQRA